MTRVCLQGQLHRSRYEAGSSLKCFLYAECTDKAMKGLDRGIPYEPSQLSPSARATSWCAATSGAYSSDSPLVVITCMTVEVVGVCTTDLNRIACPVGIFANSAHFDQQAPTDTKPKGLRALFGWASKPSPTAASVDTPTASTPTSLQRHFTANKNEEAHAIFVTPPAVVASDVSLRLFETCTAVLTCQIPPNIPPSFAGYCARYSYSVMVTCEYETFGQRRRTILKMPIRVDSPSAAVVLIRSPYVQGGWPVDGHREETDFNFDLKHTFSVTTAADTLKPSLVLAPPTADQLLSEERQVPQARVGGINRLAPRPYEVGVPAPALVGPSPQPCLIRCGTAEAISAPQPNPFAIRVLLWDTSVNLGDQIRGVIIGTTEPESAEVCLRVVATVEATEAAPKLLFRSGSVIPRESEDEESFVVAHCSTLEEFEFYLPYAGAQVPFNIPLTTGRAQQTMRTDIVSNQWRLRLVFYFALSNIAATATITKSEVSLVPIIERLQEVVIPLTVLPPNRSNKMGPLISAEDSDQGTKR